MKAAGEDDRVRFLIEAGAEACPTRAPTLVRLREIDRNFERKAVDFELGEVSCPRESIWERALESASGKDGVGESESGERGGMCILRL